MSNINRVEGGRKGRAEGYNTEDQIKPILNNNKAVCATILALKFKQKCVNVSEYKNITIKKLKDKRAADLVIYYKSIYAGVDSKKSDGASATQWMRKRISGFLEEADSNEKKIFERYFLYKTDSESKFLKDETGKSIREQFNFNTSDEDFFFNYINNKKELMIKKRWDNNPETWCDFLILYKNKIFKLVEINDLLNLEITREKMKLKRTNYVFGKYITFKPYGASSPDLQFTINKSVFDSNYSYHINLSGKILKDKSI